DCYPSEHYRVDGKDSRKEDLRIGIPNNKNHSLKKEGQTDRYHDHGQDRLAYHLSQEYTFSEQAQNQTGDECADQGYQKCRVDRHKGHEPFIQTQTDVAAYHSQLAHSQV